MKAWLIVAVLIVLAVSAWNLWFTVLSSAKEPEYTVVEKKAEYEVRRYAPYITATVMLPGPVGNASNDGFKILARYIFGHNTASVSMPMTAPVLQEPGVKMPMTAPVIIQEGSGTDLYRISFVLPSEYTLETVPKPHDERILIEQVTARTVAAYRFTWYPSTCRVAAKEKVFVGLLARDRVLTHGPVVLARYNPPFILSFLMRNELLVAVASR